ncbi:MAG: ABC transporter ATP-binding protein [Terriglobia bacterium]
MYAVEIVGLTKDYLQGFWRQRPRRALDALTLAVERGEIFGLLGPNGAGKTTTLKLLLRLLYPTAGMARILGQPFDDLRVHRQIGFLPEAPYFYDYLSGWEFLDYCAQLFGLSRDERRHQVGELVERVGLRGAEHIALRKYSRGMLQRVGLAQALINDPEVMFLDEPVLGLDPVGRREFRDLILDLRERGKTIFLSTHILPDVEMLCDRVAILNQGRLHGLGTLDEILAIQVEATEVLLAQVSAALLGELRRLGGQVGFTGNKVSIRVRDETALDAVLDLQRRHRARLVSVTPLRRSLEDYFFEQFGTERLPDLAERG